MNTKKATKFNHPFLKVSESPIQIPKNKYISSSLFYFLFFIPFMKMRSLLGWKKQWMIVWMPNFNKDWVVLSSMHTMNVPIGHSQNNSLHGYVDTIIFKLSYSLSVILFLYPPWLPFFRCIPSFFRRTSHSGKTM